jgi:hypothetical protein
MHSESRSSHEDKLLIDPSLVVASRTYLQIREELMNSNFGEIFLPQSFLNGLKDGNEELFGFYLSNAVPVPMNTLRTTCLDQRWFKATRPTSLRARGFSLFILISLKSLVRRQSSIHCGKNGFSFKNNRGLFLDPGKCFAGSSGLAPLR